MQKKELTYKGILIFWLPLLATWLMMSVEGPYLAAIIARMDLPKINLAAYGVTYSFALVLEAPIIMIMSASTAMVNGKDSFIKLRNFTYLINSIITSLTLILSIPAVFNFVALNLFKLPEDVSSLSHSALLTMILWPASIGYRRFYHGILIKNGLTMRVTYGTIIRLGAMSLTAFILYNLKTLDGAIVGALSLSVGVFSEALATRIMANNLIKNYKSGLLESKEEEELDFGKIFKFYYPLAITSMLSLGVHPMVTFLMGRSRLPVESLAVLPVVNSLVFIFRAFGLSFQEVIIALIGNTKERFLKLRNFSTGMAIFVVTALSLIAFTPLNEIWFHVVSGLSMELTEFAKVPVRVAAILPALTVLISFQRAALVVGRDTSPITIASTLEVFFILFTIFILVSSFDFIGAVAAPCGYLAGRLAANLYLMPSFKRNISFGEST